MENNNKKKKNRAFIPLLVLLIVVCIGLRCALLAGGWWLMENMTSSGSSRSSRSSQSSSDRHRNNRDNDDDDDDDDEPDVTDPVDPADMASWTVLVYMCGTDLETQTGFASMALDWMDDEEITDDINVIVETGGTITWNNDDPYFSGDAVHDLDIPDDMLGRFKIEQGEVVDLGAVELQSMGAADTLADFISWGTAAYPAERYMFVMWNHGYSEPYGDLEHDEIFYDNGNGGTINSLNTYVDESDYMNDCLTLDEVREAFSEGGTHFDLIAFNTCLSGSLEIASAVAPYGDYMVASEEIIPAIIGLPVEYITYLAQNPECTAEEVGLEILSLYEDAINDYANQYASDENIYNMFATCTMSLIDLSAMEQIDSLIGDVWEYLYYSTYDESLFTSLISIASECENYGAEGSVPGNLIDLRMFLTRSASLMTGISADDEILDLLEDNVVSVSGRARTNSYGMSVFFPSAGYPKALRSSYESMLNAEGIDYTEDQINTVVQMHMAYSLNGYVDNIDFIDGYYWYAALLEVRYAGLWAADAGVWTEVNDHLDPSYIDRVQVSAADPSEIGYEITYDDQGNITLNITSGSDAVVEVESNICYYMRLDSMSVYSLFGSQVIYPDSDAASEYDYNLNCTWLLFNGQLITVYQVEDTYDHTIFATPADINEEWSFIYICYDKASDSYSLLYCAAIDPTSGVATNDIFELQEGDSIEFMYYSVMDIDGSDPILYVRGLFDPKIYDGTVNITEEDMFVPGNGDKIVLVNFLIRDCFGNIIETSAVELHYDTNNQLIGVSEASGYLNYSNLYEVTSVWG